MVNERNIALYVILTIVTCGFFGIYWFIMLTNDIKQISGDSVSAPGGMAFLFNFISCGIYGWYWAYKRGENIDVAKNNRGIASSNTGILYIILQAFGLGLVAYALMQYEVNSMVRGYN